MCVWFSIYCCYFYCCSSNLTRTLSYGCYFHQVFLHRLFGYSRILSVYTVYTQQRGDFCILCAMPFFLIHHNWFYFNFQFVKYLGLKTSWIPLHIYIYIYMFIYCIIAQRKRIRWRTAADGADAVCHSLSHSHTARNGFGIQFIAVIFSTLIRSLSLNGLASIYSSRNRHKWNN